MKRKTKIKKWIIGLIFALLTTNVAYGRVREATWTEYEPKEVEGVTLSGNIGLGYQSVKDDLDRQKEGVSGNTVVTFDRPISEEIGLDGNIQLKKEAFTIGSEDNLEGSLRFKGRAFEVDVSSNLSNALDIVERIENKSRARGIRTGIKLSIHENFPLTANYSKSSNKNFEGDLIAENVSTEEYALGLESKFSRAQINFNLNYNKTLNPIEDSKSYVRNLGINSTIMLTRIFQLSLGIQPSNTKIMPIDESRKTTSKQVNYTVGLTSNFSESLRLTTLFDLINSLDKSETTETRGKTFNQNYDLFYQPIPVVSLNTALNLSKTEDANNSQGISANINYIPEGSRFLSQAGLDLQANRTRDNTGVTRSKNITSSLSSLFRLNEAMNLESNFSHSTEKTNSSSVFNKNLNLKFAHQVFKDLSYSLGYIWNDEKDTSKDITNSYQGDITYNFRLKEREIPLSLSQLFNYSRSNGRKINTKGTKVSIQIPITPLLSTSYSCDMNSGKTDSRSNKTTEHSIGLTIRGKTRPFTVATTFNLIDSTTADSQNIHTSLAYSIMERLSLNLNFIHNRSNQPPTTTNITTELIYSF